MIKIINDLYKPVADLLDINESEIECVLDFFYKDAKSKLENFSNIEIYLYGLGTYTAKRRKIYDLIKYYEVRKENVIKNNILKSSTKEIMIADCEDKIGKLIALRNKQESKDESRKQFKQNKSHETTRDISEQESDLGRTEE